MSDDIVQFDEFGNDFSAPTQTEASGMIGWLIHHDVVRTKQQAGIVLLAFAVVMIIATLMIFIVGSIDEQQQEFDSRAFIDPKTL